MHSVALIFIRHWVTMSHIAVAETLAHTFTAMATDHPHKAIWHTKHSHLDIKVLVQPPSTII